MCTRAGCTQRRGCGVRARIACSKGADGQREEGGDHRAEVGDEVEPEGEYGEDEPQLDVERPQDERGERADEEGEEDLALDEDTDLLVRLPLRRVRAEDVCAEHRRAVVVGGGGAEQQEDSEERDEQRVGEERE